MIHGSVATDGTKSFHHSTERISDSTRGGFVSLYPIHEWSQTEGLVNFWSDSEDVHSICVKKSKTWEHGVVLRIYLTI